MKGPAQRKHGLCTHGSIFLKWGQTEKGRDFLIKAENLNSMDYRVTFELGKFYLDQKDMEMAQKYLELTLKFYPEFQEGLLKTVEFYIAKEDYSSAIRKINELLKLDSENPQLYYYMGVCFEKLGQFEEAIRFLKSGRQYDFSNEPLRIKAEEIAVKNLPLGHSIRKELSEFYLQHAREFYKKKQNLQAVLFYKRGLRVNPLSVETRTELAQMYREKGWIDLYLRTLKAGLFTNPENQELKDLFELNQRFLWETLSFEKKRDQYQNPAFPGDLFNAVSGPKSPSPFQPSKNCLSSHEYPFFSVKEIQDQELNEGQKGGLLRLV